MRTLAFGLLLIFALSATACVQSRRSAGPCAPGPGPAADVAESPIVPPPDELDASPRDHAIWSAKGRRMTTAQLHTAAGRADVVLFGELHGHPVGSREQLAMLKHLARGKRPVALAMEFFERDVQADLDAYLAGELEEAEFLKRTRRGKAYPRSHRPLIELCKAQGLPVIAANAPRPLVTAFRKSGAAYPAWLAERSDAERANLPRRTSRPDDAYYERFLQLMGPERGPPFFRAQALWDDAMAEAIADFRKAHPKHVVLLLVGTFHVSGQDGTLTKLRARRPGDRVFSLGMGTAASTSLRFDEHDRDTADALLLVAPRKRAPQPMTAPVAPKAEHPAK